MTADDGLPPIAYLAVYRANLSAPQADLYIVKTPDAEIRLSPGNIQFSFSTPVVQYAPPAVGMTLAERRCVEPPGSYVVIRVRIGAMDPELVRTMAALTVAEATCVFDLRYPGLIAEKLYEGMVNEPGHFVYIAEGPLRLTAQPVRDARDVADEIAGDFVFLRKLSEEDRSRFQLTARWFRRGQEAINPVDKLLFLWTVLEIFTATEGRNVPKEASESLRERLYPDLSSQEIKGKTKIGRIYGERSDIVHKGKAFVAAGEDERYSDYLNRLEAIATTCLRILAGMPPGDELDKYVREN